MKLKIMFLKPNRTAGPFTARCARPRIHHPLHAAQDRAIQAATCMKISFAHTKVTHQLAMPTTYEHNACMTSK